MSQEIRLKKNDELQDASIVLKIIIYFLFGFGPVTGNVILVLFGILSNEFNVTPNALLISIPAFMFPFAIVQLFSGAISDVKGRFPVMILGLILFGAGWFFAAISYSLLLFIIGNALAGFGFGFVNPILIALMTDITPPGPQVPKKMGFLGAVAALGVGLGPLLAGQIVRFGWRYIYIIFILIIFLSLLALFKVPRPSRKSNKDFGPRVLLHHLSQELQRVTVILMVVSAFLISSTYLATIIWTSRTFSGVLEEATIGILLSVVGVAGAISGVANGYLIKRIGLGFTLLLGLSSLLIAMISLILLGDITRPEVLFYIAICLGLSGIAGGILFPSILYYSQVISPERRGTLAGLATTGYFIGNALVPMIYEPFFLIGGINAVYMAIFVISILLLPIIGLLFILAKRQR
jgi:DHA1 family bicyclomycin/chloramphenicol resistance-like MFS transporter